MGGRERGRERVREDWSTYELQEDNSYVNKLRTSWCGKYEEWLGYVGGKTAEGVVTRTWN